MHILSHKGRDLPVFLSTLTEMGLKDGQDVTQEQASRAIELNALILLPEMRQRRAAGEKGVPNPDRLRRLLTH